MRMRHSKGMGRAATVGAIAAGLGLAVAPSLALAQGNQNQQDEQGTPEGQGNPSPGNMGNQGAQPAPGGEETAVQTTSATLKVAKVDRANRTITFREQNGETLEVKAGPDVNLSNVHPGQMLDVTYYQEMAVAVTPPGQPAPRVQTTLVMPGGVTARQTTVTARVASVDKENNTVRIKGPDGAMHTLHVTNPDVQQRLNDIKPGEHVTVSYTQAVAITAISHQT